ncbi:MAG: nickel-dependent lactate racemase [Firmicutes bacterium]|nr:nickel-dependent lactate racemase [Bacillota bacterium]
MNIKLRYGNKNIEFSLKDENVAGVLYPQSKINKKAEEIIAQAMSAPISSEPLYKIVERKKPDSVAIIISDATRPIPYKLMLPPVLNELHLAGIKSQQITIIIGTGCHRANSCEETKLALGEDIIREYQVINHNCDDELTSIGRLTDGTELLINTMAAKANLKIALGSIIPHKLAGYSGGSKAILPGISGRAAITANHSMMNDPRAAEGKWLNNPVRRQMDEAAKLAGLEYILNVVCNENNQVMVAVAGDVENAWQEGVKHCQQISSVSVPYKCPVTIISCGGYPRDLNVYQSIKSITNASKLTEKRGTIVVVARCQDGYGDDIFCQWLKDAFRPEDLIERINNKFVLGGHKGSVVADIVKRHEVVLVSDLTEKEVKNLFMVYQPNINSALRYVEKKHGPEYRAWVIPYAGLVLPKVER